MPLNMRTKFGKNPTINTSHRADNICGCRLPLVF